MIGARKLFAPEVVQTSTMDCGPAVLKCLLEGFGVGASFGRLREACQTSVDGTSIDDMESVANRLGLRAEQVLLPEDYLWLCEAQALPSAMVTRCNDGTTHFVVVWRRLGPWLQIMDPSVGRRWVRADAFSRDLFRHDIEVDASDWYEWACSEDVTRVHRRRLRDLGAPDARSDMLIDMVRSEGHANALAALDAALRMAGVLRRAGALGHWTGVERMLSSLLIRTFGEAPGEFNAIPRRYWAVQPLIDEPDSVRLRGAVLLRVKARHPTTARESDEPLNTDSVQALEHELAPGEPEPHLEPELDAALNEKPLRPALELWRLVREEGSLTPIAFCIALGLAVGAIAVEALLFRGLFDLAEFFSITSQRVTALAGLIGFVALLLVFELSLAGESLRIGRHLEMRLRMRLLEKLPKLNDRYLQSRPVSDMAERSHSLYALRSLPGQVADLMRGAWELIFTLVGIAFISPASVPLSLCVVALTFGILVLAKSALSERDLRVRSHGASLQRFYLDALLGCVPIRTHAAERAVEREHEGLLVEWARSALRPLRLTIAIESFRSFASIALIGWLLFSHIERTGVSGDLLLLVYWVLKLPALGEEIVSVALQLPSQRSVSLRLLELLNSPEQDAQLNASASVAQPIARNNNVAPVGKANGAAIEIRGAQVVAGGHRLLRDVELDIGAGEHVAVVGTSGAGKSTLLNLLLGFHTPLAGSVIVDGQSLDANTLQTLRAQTAWLDPAVQLWNRSLLQNLEYSPQCAPHSSLTEVMRDADLLDVLSRLPDGLRSCLSEGGTRLSGGEGQRVRLARALWQRNVRLALLDEPFRGLDRAERERHLENVRRVWANATLICVTHDVCETQAFERVLVVSNGRIAEDGSPKELINDANTLYSKLLASEQTLQRERWVAGRAWSHARLDGGRLALNRVEAKS